MEYLCLKAITEVFRNTDCGFTCSHSLTVNPAQQLVFKTEYCLMHVKNIAEGEHSAIPLTAFSYHLSLRHFVYF